MTVAAAAAGVVGAQALPGSDETVTLTGTAIAPNLMSTSAIDPTVPEAGWRFLADGTVDGKDGFGTGTWQQEFDGVQWTSAQDAPTQDRWIRFTYESGDSPDGGSSLNTWHKLVGTGEGTRSVTWSETGGGFNTTDGRVKVEISSDSGGSTILGTGYYRGRADSEP